MKKIYFLSSCSTCQRIIQQLDLKNKHFTFQDIKTESISEAQLDDLKKKAGSYEALFSRVALKYKSLPLKPTSEKEYKSLILNEYTFLKRPVILVDDHIFIGNHKNTIAEAEKILQSK